MDCRAVSHHFKRQCEETALRRIKDNFSAAVVQQRYERLIEDDRGQETVMVFPSSRLLTLPYYADPDPYDRPTAALENARKLSSFSFDIADAV